MNPNPNFYTLKGYALLEHTKITASMEDYLEMVYRLYLEEKTLRIGRVAEYLHVKPSSASKMITNLKIQGLVGFERYGQITLTERGIALGEYLLFRHDILNRFFCFINHTEDELEQVEKVEHFIDSRTVWHIKEFLEQQDSSRLLPAGSRQQ